MQSNKLNKITIKREEITMLRKSSLKIGNSKDEDASIGEIYYYEPQEQKTSAAPDLLALNSK